MESIVQALPATGANLGTQRDSRGHEALKGVLHTLKVHDEAFKNNAAPTDVAELWNKIANNDQSDLMSELSSRSDSFFITRSIFRLIKEFNGELPKNLAFAPAGRNILVWAEVADDDVDSMRRIVRAIAKANGANDNSDIELIPEIVEESEGRTVPEQFLVYASS